MEKFTKHEGVAVPLLIDNVNTDQIIPSREMKRVSKEGLADGLFANMRYADAAQGGRAPNRRFVLNHPNYINASILVSGGNFGCGSSREHAVWALHEYGFRAIIAESFGTIFFENCIANGVLPVVLDREHIQTITDAIEAASEPHSLTVDLEEKAVEAPSGRYDFELEEAKRELLIAGLKPIDVVMKHGKEIDRFVTRDHKRRPWVYDHPALAARGRA